MGSSQSIILDYHPSNAAKNFTLIKENLADVYDGKATNLSNQFMILYPKNKKEAEELEKEIKSRFDNIEIKILHNSNILINLVSKKKQYLGKSIQEIRRSNLKKMERSLNKLKGHLDHVENPDVAGLLEQAQNEYNAMEWLRELDRQEKKIIKAEQDAEAWAMQLDEQKRAKEIAQHIKPVLASIKSLHDGQKQESKMKQEKRIHALKQKMHDVIAEIKKFNITTLKTVDDHGAAEWQRQLSIPTPTPASAHTPEAAQSEAQKAAARRQLKKAQEHLEGVAGMFEAAQSEAQKAAARRHAQTELDRCELWKKDKRHNPFNKTKRGRILTKDSKIKIKIDAFCNDKEGYCNSKEKSEFKRKLCRSV